MVCCNWLIPGAAFSVSERPLVLSNRKLILVAQLDVSRVASPDLISMEETNTEQAATTSQGSFQHSLNSETDTGRPLRPLNDDWYFSI